MTPQFSEQPAFSRPPGLFETYGLPGLIRLGRDWLLTRMLQPQARLLRWPFYLRGKRWVRIGARFTTGPGVRLDAFPPSTRHEPVLTIGHDVQFNDAVHVAAVDSVRIGDRVLIASRVFIADHNHGTYGGETEHTSPFIPPQARLLSSAPVVIEDDVWIGEGAAILPGVTIGRGSVIGALSLVNRNVPPFSIAAGNPARVIKRYNEASGQWQRA